MVISIHALREEGDCQLSSVPVALLRFLSTPSARRATFFNGFGVPGYLISIHALREEGDVLVWWYNDDVKRFLSTPSARRATFTSFVKLFL